MQYLCRLKRPHIPKPVIYEHITKYISSIDFVKWNDAKGFDACDNYKKGIWKTIIENGKVKVAKCLIKKIPIDVEYSLDFAVKHNHLGMAKFIHALDLPKVATNIAMESAVLNGNLRIVKWLYKNRKENIACDSLMTAIEHQHIDVVDWLYKKLKKQKLMNKHDFENMCHINHVKYNTFKNANYIYDNNLSSLKNCANNLSMPEKAIIYFDNRNIEYWGLPHKKSIIEVEEKKSLCEEINFIIDEINEGRKTTKKIKEKMEKMEKMKEEAEKKEK
jgi:hypothetical protein